MTILQGLREHVIAGTITASDLVALSAADLASHEQKLAIDLDPNQVKIDEQELEQIKINNKFKKDDVFSYKHKTLHKFVIGPNKILQFSIKLKEATSKQKKFLLINGFKLKMLIV